MTSQPQKSQLENKGIAITRPIDQAQKLTEMIVAHGGVPISFPLVKITVLHDYSAFNQTIELLNTFNWAIFISSNAVQNAMPRIIKHFGCIPRNLKFAAIGPVTALELTKFGVDYVLTPEGRFDSEAFLATHEMQAVDGQKIIIFRGEGGRELLANSLRARGAKIVFAESYQRTNPQSNCLLVEKFWGKNQLHAIVITSSEAMRYLLKMASNADWLKHIFICVNHARVAEPALALGLKVKVAEAQGDAAMLDLLKKTLA